MPDVVQISIVTLSPNADVSILQPQSLASNRIVPDDWQFAEPPIVTLPIAQLSYINGVSITMNGEKLTVSDNSPPQSLISSVVPRLASQLVSLTASVRYRAMGMNFLAFTETGAAERFMIDRFLSDGPWNQPPLETKTLGLIFTYELADSSVLKLKINAGSLQRSPQDATKKGLLLRLNYHKDLDNLPPSDTAQLIEKLFAERLQHLDTVLKTVVEGVEAC